MKRTIIWIGYSKKEVPMRTKFYTVTLLGITLLFTSCRSARKLYEKGRYDEAVELAAKKLQKDPGDAGLISTLRNAYRYAVEDHEGRIRANEQSRDELKWERNYFEYESLQRLHDAIQRVPDVYALLGPADYRTELVSHREKAGEVRYDRGLSFMQRYDKESYRQAYREFQAALGFIPGHRDALQKKEEAFAYAVTNVVIVPMQQEGGYVYSNYAPGRSNLDDELIRRLQNNSGHEFVRYYSAWDARGRKIRVDKEISIRFTRLDPGFLREERSSRKLNRRVLVKETVYRPDSVVREYAQVQATIYETRQSLLAAADLLVTVRDERGRREWSHTYQATHQWNSRFSHFTGDERALGEEDKKQLNRHREMPPAESEMLGCLLDEISNNALCGLRAYINRNN